MNTGGIDMFPDFDAENVECYEDVEDEEVYCLTPYGVMLNVFEDYGIHAKHLTARVAEHLFEDLMESLVKQGYIGRRKDDEQAD